MLTDPLVYAQPETRVATESPVSAISWAAIIGGAVAAAATSLVLVLLGSGIGLAWLSPWPNSGASTTAFSIGAGIWLIVVQWLSSGLGGFITGRLRTKWVRVHDHEVFFRDTAHGLLTWGLATVIGALLLTSAVGTGTRGVASVAAGAAQGAGDAAGGMATSQTRAYDVDGLFRGENPDLASSGQGVRAQVTRIFASSAANGSMSSDDRSYLSGLVAQRTGIPQADAQKRVDDAVNQEKAAETKARQVADAARKSTSAIAIFTALSMLVGAFIASAAAAFGGAMRDEYS